ncbi:DUF4055 domain-containing protein [Parasphingorhabdus sp. JC815]|uniref:DUF4055 domain-containing protein n=1 Tax=Parasphingorhabdus sp. JC815 TaxID=3232140 RepID=UPI00345AA227
MSVKTFHPAITAARRNEWQLMRDCMDGENAIKGRAEVYLPMPSGFAGQDDGGVAMYNAYRGRAQFPELLAPSVGAMVGIIHGRELAIEMPSEMNFLWENADGDNLPLEAFHRRITRELLVIGGYCVLTDAPKDGGDPYLVGLRRDKLINWDVDFWVLDETSNIRKGFIWEQLERYRVLQMDGGYFTAQIYQGETLQVEEIEVRGRGGEKLPRIPFAVANAMDLSPTIEAPPLIGVANAAKAIYQLSADYRHQLYMSGQETLVAIDGEAPDMVGAGAVHQMNSGANNQADLKYVSPSCIGIEAHKIAMADNREAAVMAGARLFEHTAQGAESGEAKRLRYASETATLVSIAQSSSMLLERALKNAAMIMGLPENNITVEAPTDLMDNTMTPQDLAALFGVYVEGGMSWETYFAAGQKGGIFSPEQTAANEAKLLDGPAAVGGDVA